MALSFKYITTLFVTVFQLSVIAQNEQSPATDLFKQAERLVNQRDFEKAKLTLKLYQKYEEKNLQNWLKAQTLIIRSELELNNFNSAKNLIKSSKDKLKLPNASNFDISKKILFLEAEIFEIENDFKKAEGIYRGLIKKKNSPDIQINLANNLIDRILSSHTDNVQNDYEEVRKIVSKYEKNPKRNPLELIRIKQKVSSYQMVNKETLVNLQKLETYWLKKDEYTVFKMYLNNVLRNYEQAYKIWKEDKDIISLKTHPLTVPVLSSLARHYLNINLNRTREIVKALPVLVRDSQERNLVELLSIELLISENKAAEALSVYENSVKNNPDGSQRSEMEINLAEAYLELKDFKLCRKLLKNISGKKIIDSELKSRKVFIDASLLQAEGKDKEAAVLFLRVGQTATNAQTALKSLFMAGKAFYTAKQCNRAIIAFKILLEKKRSTYTDEALYYLSLSHAECKDYPNALSTIDQLILTGKNPELKKKALFEKGDYWLMAGKSSKAIEAYNDYTVVYTNDSRNAAIWYKIYKIHLNQKDIKQSEIILDKIIKNSSSNSPEFYSSALHQKALIHQLKGESRESISLWQKYLEFNQKVETKNKDEVKLMLAAAFQNSDTQNLTASTAIYEEILLKSEDGKIKEIALQNLLEITKGDPKSSLAIFKKLLNSKQKYTAEVVNLLCTQAVKLKPLIKDCESFISRLKNVDLRNFWASRILYERQNKEDVAKALKLLNSVKDEKLYVKKLALERDLYALTGDKNSCLNASLELIYYLTAKKSWEQCSDLTEMDKSAVFAIKLLTDSGRSSQAAKIHQRLLTVKFPISKSALDEIEKVLKVKK